MININNKNTSTMESDTFTEGKLSDVMKVKNNGLEFLDKHSENIQKTLKPVGDYTDLLVQGAKGIDDKVTSLTKDRRSIIARAKNSVLQFPMYMANTVNISAAHILSKAFERVYASFVQNALAQNPIIDEDSINDLAFLRQFHTNLNESGNSLFNEYYQPIDDFDQIMQESICNTVMCENGIIAKFHVVPSDNPHIIAENARLINEPLTGFESFFLTEKNNTGVSNYRKRETSREDNMTKDEVIGLNLKQVKELFPEPAPTSPPPEPTYPKKPVRRNIKEVMDTHIDPSASKEEKEELRKRIEDTQRELDAEYRRNIEEWEDQLDEIASRYVNEMDAFKKANEKYSEELSKFINDIKQGKRKVYTNDGLEVKYNKETDSFYAIKTGRVATKIDAKETNVEFKAPVMLRDSEIKKINGMLPYTFDASFMIRGEGNRNTGNIVHYIVGVKTVLHLINPKNLSNELRDLITGDIKNLQKVRYKTGEISFWKDYIFRKDILKADAAKHLDGSKRWINTLKRLADYNKQYGTMLDKPRTLIAGDIPIPNATLVLTQPDVLRMKAETGINLEDVSMAKKLARNLFLIAIVIVDSSAGNMKVLFPDNDTDWDVQSLSSIEAEVAKTDNSNLVKELNRIINK